MNAIDLASRKLGITLLSAFATATPTATAAAAAAAAVTTASCASNKAPNPSTVPEPSSAVSASFVDTFASGPDGFDTKTVYFDTGREVVVFDAQFTPVQAEQAIAAIAARTRNPITHVVITHPNPDKFGGLAAFVSRGARVVASRATRDALPAVHAYKKHFFVEVAKMFKSDEFPSLSQVDFAFDKETTLTLAGGARVELRELGMPGVSGNQTVAWIPAHGTLVVGDLVHHGVHAWLEGGVESGRPRPTLQSWKSALDQLAARYPGDARVEGGRGTAAPLRIAVASQKEYLDAADRIVSGYVAGLGPSGRAELTQSTAAVHWTELTRRFEAAFPDRKLSSLVTYGVYGLALFK
jgi:glyoxylase-like metal-dependent hydrolase (beta-lactamase superfamily II)